jgi:hypothetical protein
MRWLLVSLIVHAIVLVLFGQRERATTLPPQHAVVRPQAVLEPVVVDIVSMIDNVESRTGGAGGGGGSAGNQRHAAARVAPRRSADAWQQVRVTMEAPSANGTGSGLALGRGQGNGLGEGAGGSLGGGLGDVPMPPPATEEARSRARPARLVYPRRDLEVEHDADLFIAKVTVDEDGDVIGARMIKTRPGARGDQAASAIWQFRYAPALDDRGSPIRSTFDQPFQIR